MKCILFSSFWIACYKMFPIQITSYDNYSRGLCCRKLETLRTGWRRWILTAKALMQQSAIFTKNDFLSLSRPLSWGMPSIQRANNLLTMPFSPQYKLSLHRVKTCESSVNIHWPPKLQLFWLCACIEMFVFPI